MGMMEAFQDFDFAVQVIFELLVEFRQIDRFDRYEGTSHLQIAPSALVIKQIWRRAYK